MKRMNCQRDISCKLCKTASGTSRPHHASVASIDRFLLFSFLKLVVRRVVPRNNMVTENELDRKQSAILYSAVYLVQQWIKLLCKSEKGIIIKVSTILDSLLEEEAFQNLVAMGKINLDEDIFCLLANQSLFFSVVLCFFGSLLLTSS